MQCHILVSLKFFIHFALSQNKTFDKILFLHCLKAERDLYVHI